MSDQSPVRRFAVPVAVFGVVVPLLVLGVLSVAAGAVDVAFGDLLFALTVVAAAAWVVVGVGSGRRLDAARPSGELHRGAATDYGRETARGTYTRLSTPIRLLVVFTGTIVLGWLGVLAL